MATFRPNSVRQRESNGVTQLDLLTRPIAEPAQLDMKVVRKQPDIRHAVLHCLTTSGLDWKEAYGPLEMDPGYWSRILSGKNDYPAGRLNQLMDLCGNEAPLAWLVESRGWDYGSLRKHQSGTDEIIARQSQRIADLERLLKLKAEVGL